jgi:hypothetical protein
MLFTAQCRANVADDQRHHILGEGVWIRSQFTDRVVRPAIRSAQLELFSLGVVRWLVGQARDRAILPYSANTLQTPLFVVRAAVAAQSERPSFAVGTEYGAASSRAALAPR